HVWRNGFCLSVCSPIRFAAIVAQRQFARWCRESALYVRRQFGMRGAAGDSIGAHRCRGMLVMVEVQHKVSAALVLPTRCVATVIAANSELSKDALLLGWLRQIAWR